MTPPQAISALRASDLTPRMVEQWSNLLAGNPDLSSPFFAPQYTLAVASVVPDVYVGLVEQEGELVAFLPYERSRFRIGKRLRLCDYQGVIAKKGLTLDIKQLVRGCGLSSWDFDHLLAAQDFLQPFHRSVAESPIINISNGFENYLLERRQAGRTELIKRCGTKMRKLEREAGKLRLEVHEPEPALVPQLLTWQSHRYKSRHSSDVLHGILGQLLRQQTSRLKGTLSVLYAGESIAALHFGLRSCSTWHWWFPTYNPQFEKYSPGIILLLKMIEASAQLGIRIIDLGSGAMDYKSQLMNGAVRIAAGSVEVSPWLSFGRTLIRNTKSRVRGKSGPVGAASLAHELPK